MKIEISIEEGTSPEALNEEYNKLKDMRINLIEEYIRLSIEFKDAVCGWPFIPSLKRKILNLFRSDLDQVLFSEEEEQVWQENQDRIESKIEENEQMTSLINQRLKIVIELLKAHEQSAHS